MNFRRAFLCAAFLVAVLIDNNAQATTLLVYNKNDSGAGSLRQAISDNKALGGGNSIVFSNIVTGTITLTGGPLMISNNLTLIGPGANVLAISGNNAGRVFLITNAATVSISGLTISNGALSNSVGAGILNSATLTISNCVISGNSAAFSASGGGIMNEGASTNFATLTVMDSTISGNYGYFNGGGFFNSYGTMTISNCTISGNTARFDGGGIYNAQGILTVIASTFSGNTSSNATDACGIFNFSTLKIGNTILSAGLLGKNLKGTSGTITSLGYNLCSDDGGGYLTGVGDQINTAPNLGPLQDNGGPTPTHVPLSGSPAIDQGKNFGLITDQRGRPRPVDNPAIPNASIGDGSDIGAVEVGAASLIVLNTNDSGAGSLRQAILDASPNEGDTITFSPNVTNLIRLTSGELLINNSITIHGPGANVLAVSGNASNRIFHVTNASAVTLSGLTITNGYSSGVSGGGILSEHSALTVSNCVVAGNSTTVNGGGIYNNGLTSGTSFVAVVACTIHSNSASVNGGGIYNAGASSGNATFTVSASTISSNTASTGGAIYNTGRISGHGTVTILGSTLAGNSASGSGGGIYLDGISSGFAKLEIGDTILKAGASGTNIFNSSGSVVSDGYNLSSDGASGLLTNVTDQINIDPLLGPLQNNGGPTPTMALLSNSPAIDKGKGFGAITDQRGAPRPFNFPSITNAVGGDGSDIGAFELANPILSIARQLPNAVVSWPDYYGRFQLQSVATLMTSNSWSNVTNPVSNNGASNWVLVPANASNSFFRLK